MADSIGFGPRGSVDGGTLIRLPYASVFTVNLSQQVIDLINAGGSGGTINPSTGFTNVSGDMRGISDSSYFAWDQGLDAVGFTKRAGAHGALAYAGGGGTTSLGLDIIEYTAQGTINPDGASAPLLRARWDLQGDFYQYQNTFLQGNATVTGTTTHTGATTFNAAGTFNAGLTGTTAALSSTVSAPTITQNGVQVIDTVTVTNNATATKTAATLAIVNSLTPTFTSATIPTLSGNVSVTGTLSVAGQSTLAGLTATTGVFSAITISATNAKLTVTDGAYSTGMAVASASGNYHSSAVIGDAVVRGDAAGNTQGVLIAAGPTSTGYLRVATSGSTFGGTLSVLGASTLAAMSATTGNFSGTLTVTGNSLFGGDVQMTQATRPTILTTSTNIGLQVRSNGTGTLQLNADNAGPVQIAQGGGATTVSGTTFTVMGASTLAAMSATTGTFSSTLAITGVTTISSIVSGSSVGDKIHLWSTPNAADAYGFGLQGSRLIAFVPSGAAFAIRSSATSGGSSSGADVLAVTNAGAVTGSAGINLTGVGASSVGGNFTASIGVFAKNKGLYASDLNHGLTADSNGNTYLLNTIGVGSNAAKAAFFHLTDGASDIGRIHSTAITINGGSYSGNVWTGTDISTNTIYGVGQGTGSAQLAGSGFGNLALFTVGSDNIVDGAVTNAKLSPVAIAIRNVATGTLRDTTNTLFRAVSQTGSLIDTPTGQETDGLTFTTTATAPARVVDGLAFGGYAIKFTAGVTNTVNQVFGPNYTPLKPGSYKLTMYVRTTASASTANLLSISTYDLQGFVQPSDVQTFYTPADLGSTNYVGLAYRFTVTAAMTAGGANGLQAYLRFTGLQDVFLSHITVEPDDPLIKNQVTTTYISDLAVTSAKILTASVYSLTAGVIQSEDLYLGTGGHIYFGAYAQTGNGNIPTRPTGNAQRLELNAGGLYAYNGSAQTFRIGVDGSITLSGNLTASTGTISGAALVATSALGGSLTISGANTDSRLVANPVDGLQIISEGTTNLITNPSVEVNTTGYSGVGLSTLARDTTRAYVGTASLKLVTNGASVAGPYFTSIAVTPGVAYSASVYAFNNAATSYNQSIEWFNGGTFLSATSATVVQVANVWTRLKVSGTAPANATAAVATFYTSNSQPNGASFWYDAFQFEAKAFTTRYCDGDQYGCSWAGTAHASTSTRTTGLAVTKLSIYDANEFSGTIQGGNIFGSTIAGTKFVSYGTGAGLLQFDAAGITKINNAGTTVLSTDVNGNLTLTGTITAGAGLIGGFTIEPTNLFSGAGTTRVQMSSAAAGGFWAGATARDSSPFYVRPDGFLKASSANIAGWTVDASEFSSSNGRFYMHTGGYLIGYMGGAGGITGSTPAIIMDSRNGSQGFRIFNGTTNSFAADSNGNVSITGEIKANSGYIGTSTSGWNITSGNFSSGPGGNNTINLVNLAGGGPYIQVIGTGQDVVMDGRSGQPNMFYVSSAAGLTFAVSKTGVVTAGGFTLGATELFSGSGSTRVQMSSAAAGGFWAGADARDSAPFYVRPDGFLKASSGTIGGFTLTATTISSPGIILNTSNDTISLSGSTAILSIQQTSGGLVENRGTASSSRHGVLVGTNSGNSNSVGHYPNGIAFDHNGSGSAFTTAKPFSYIRANLLSGDTTFDRPEVTLYAGKIVGSGETQANVAITGRYQNAGGTINPNYTNVTLTAEKITLTGGPGGTAITGALTTAGVTVSGTMTATTVNGTTDVQANSVSLPRGINSGAGSSTITSTFTVTATETVVTGCSVTVTVPTGGRTYSISFISQISSTVAGDDTVLRLRDGGASAPTNTSTALLQHNHTNHAANRAQTVMADRVIALTAGTHIISLFAIRNAGTGSVTLPANATSAPIQMSVIDIGV